MCANFGKQNWRWFPPFSVCPLNVPVCTFKASPWMPAPRHGFFSMYTTRHTATTWPQPQPQRHTPQTPPQTSHVHSHAQTPPHHTTCTPTHNTTRNITRRHRDRERQSKKTETEREEKTEEERQERREKMNEKLKIFLLNTVKYDSSLISFSALWQVNSFLISANYLFYAVTVFFFLWFLRLCSYSSYAATVFFFAGINSA